VACRFIAAGIHSAGTSPTSIPWNLASAAPITVIAKLFDRHLAADDVGRAAQRIEPVRVRDHGHWMRVRLSVVFFFLYESFPRRAHPSLL
jgi:hypothetical protein